MAKKFAILLAFVPLAACDQYSAESFVIPDAAKSVAVGGLVGGATNYVIGANVGKGAAVGAIAAAGAQLLTQ